VKVLGEDSWGLKEHCVRRGLDPSTARGRGSAFDAAFAKLLWPLVST